MGIYALSQRSGETFDAAGKAMHDVFAVLKSKGSKTIWSMPKSCNKYMKILDLPYLVGFLLVKAGKKDYIFYSIPENHIKIKLLKKLQKIKKYQIICFINDLNAFRYGNAESEEVKQHMRAEASVIGMADHVLIPNKNTIQLLEENGVHSNLVPVGIWDYLMNENQVSKIKQQQKKEKADAETVSIAFAGNLNKSEFLSEMKLPEQAKIKLDLWGKLDEARKDKLPEFCEYHGVLPADEVPEAVCNADYGLVWDGTGADEIEGGLGEYLKYNNSHKCGLYLAAGVPAIVWSKAGMANFVQENNCGICIDKLSDLPEQIRHADYEEIKKNALKVAEKLQKGYYLSSAFDRILK